MPTHFQADEQSLYSPSRWSMLATLFLSTHQEIYNIPAVSPFEVALSAGLSALKTSTCYASPRHQSKTSINTCPICSAELNSLAEGVPFAHAVRSHLVDALTGEPMEGENEPIVLPNGQVYGSKSLYAWAEKNGVAKDIVVDPLTTASFLVKSVRKAYVL